MSFKSWMSTAPTHVHRKVVLVMTRHEDTTAWWHLQKFCKCSEAFVTSEFPEIFFLNPLKDEHSDIFSTFHAQLDVRLRGCQTPFVLNSWLGVDFIQMETILELLDLSVLFGVPDFPQCLHTAAVQQVSGGRLVQQICQISNSDTSLSFNIPLKKWTTHSKNISGLYSLWEEDPAVSPQMTLWCSLWSRGRGTELRPL